MEAYSPPTRPSPPSTLIPSVGEAEIVQEEPVVEEDEIPVSDRERLQAGRDFALRILPSDYFCPVATRKEKKIIPISGFRQRDRTERAYPMSVFQTVGSVAEVIKERKDIAALPVSTVEYEASSYKFPVPLWYTDGENFSPFTSVVGREAAPSGLRRMMQASAAAFDVLAYIKMVADAQVKALSSGFSSEEDMLGFQASTEALALASSDALALSSVSLANATLFVRQRALGQTKSSTTVKDQALRSEFMPDMWFGPAALAAIEEEKRDPSVQARAIGSAISGAFNKVVRHSAPAPKSDQRPFRMGGGRRGSAKAQVFRNTAQLGEFTRGRGSGRGRGRGRGRGAKAPAATATARDR